MSSRSHIEWTDRTWNPAVGCRRVSRGCDKCYAMRLARRSEFNPSPTVAAAYAGTTVNREGVDWSGKVNILPDRLTEPLTWRAPARVFVNSMADLFYQVPSDFIAQVFGIMALTPRHTYQVLTKRHARMRSILRNPAFQIQVLAWAHRLKDDRHEPSWNPGARTFTHWPLPNVHLGVSVEDQRWADIRVPALLETPAAVRWISAEPLLGPIVLADHWIGADPYRQDEAALGWVVAGGESGPGARPIHPAWARSLRDQCVANAIPYQFKQWGEWGPAPSNYGPDVPNHARPYVQLLFADEHDLDGQIMLRAGKRRTGRVLDGRTWDGYPAVAP